ncbi:hypothetical protein MIMGU_mgv1a023362mg [Erythranthe guttata]|uniref:Uncharacterized protein n=1 Tax=Erythranthe guttata TaxID=4155 RepID=A0A022QA76_ERYGU|nr:hypothetical protein MIMGU_mgv1a019760mg [Erythranthe guttata]EYU25582.1 hypothetical protein MIMGU_mgv1a023362mg [Erythranthe guttata]
MKWESSAANEVNGCLGILGRGIEGRRTELDASNFGYSSAKITGGSSTDGVLLPHACDISKFSKYENRIEEWFCKI